MIFWAQTGGVLIGAALVLLFVYKTVQIYIMRKKYRHIPGPPTSGLFGFYMGNLDQIISALKKGYILSDLIVEWVQLYGTVLKFQVFDQTVVFTIDQDGVKELLITRNFPKIKEIYQNVGFPFGERFLGNGLITNVNDADWKQRRSMLNEGFHRKSLVEYLDDFNSTTDVLLEKLRMMADGTTVVNLFSEINHALLDIIAQVAFGMHVDSINDPSNQLNKQVYESLKGFYRITFEPLIHYNPAEWGFIRRYKNVIRKLRNMAKQHIIKRIASIQEDGELSDDILNKLINNYQSNKIDIEDIVDDVLTFFVAGQETTANTLAFAFLELARNPDCLQKVREELNSVFGSRTEVKMEDLNRLVYCGGVYKETLRLWPAIPEIGRIVKRTGFYINGYAIPANTIVQVSTYVSARYESYFENSRCFQPERFLPDSEHKIQNYTYFPFSLGPRNCLGQNFAQMLGKVIIAKIVKNFEIKLDETQNMGIIQEATLRPADGTKCFLSLPN